MVTESYCSLRSLTPEVTFLTRISRWLPASALTLGLTASGLVLVAPAQANPEANTEPETLLDADATWRYLDDGTDPSNGLSARTDWAAPEFDDSDWQEAAGSFGALRGQLTELSGGYLPDNLLNQYYRRHQRKRQAFFFRSDFTVDTDDIDDEAVITGAVRYDDAAIVYVTGERVDGFHDDGLPFTEEGEDRNMVFGGSTVLLPPGVNSSLTKNCWKMAKTQSLSSSTRGVPAAPISTSG